MKFSLVNGWNILTNLGLIRTGNLTIDGDVHLIISDISELSIGQITINPYCSLTIYCQTVNKGLITIETNEGTGIDVRGSLTINGCIITANATNDNDDDAYGINVSGSFTVNGGFVTANATGGSGINVSGGSFTVNGGTVRASSYNGNLTIADDWTYTDGTNTIDPETTIDEPVGGTTYQPEWTGSGTSDADPILIKTTSDLDLLAKRVNAGNDYSGTYFKLANDIWYWYNIYLLLDSWGNYEENYTAIGGKDTPFCGHFDGDNHFISSIYINKTGQTDADSYQGLFGHVGTGGTVKNVILYDAQITGFQYVGGIVGAIEGGTVTACRLAPQDTQDNSAFFTLMAQRTAALTAVERSMPLSTDVAITLYGRTLYKDGDWNTLCLPFDLSAEQIADNTDFAGVEIRELSNASFDGGTLTLNFTPASDEGAVTDITAGTPYIIRWESGSNFTPTFSGVTIDATVRNKACDLGGGKSITFKGTYSPVPFASEDRSILFLGGNNTLYYPDGTATTTINACRAYFQLEGIEAGAPANGVKAFVLNFEDERPTGVEEIVNGKLSNGKSLGAWYSIDGRRFSGKPTKQGIYIHNGNKVIIK